jgi:hypothetical protein
VAGSSYSLWLLWGALFATLLGWLAAPFVIAPRAHPWHDAQTAVAGFVLAIFALVAGWGSFALRESLVERAPRRGAKLLALWLLCAAIGSFGGLISYGSNRPPAAWPYLVGAAALFVIHAPRAGLLSRLQTR